jgi:hypothetical protein
MGLKTSLACHAACYGIADTLATLVNVFDGLAEDAAISGEMLEAKAIADIAERVSRAKWFYSKRREQGYKPGQMIPVNLASV